MESYRKSVPSCFSSRTSLPGNIHHDEKTNVGDIETVVIMTFAKEPLSYPLRIRIDCEDEAFIADEDNSRVRECGLAKRRLI